jgi:hypothetical protein
MGRYSLKLGRRILVLLAVTLMAAFLTAGTALAEPENTPPNCGRGQSTAFSNFQEPGKDEQYRRHIGKISNCAFGFPPAELYPGG